MLKPAVTVALFALPLLATSAAQADTVTTEADTLVVVTPNAPVVVTQGAPQSVAQPIQPPGAAEMPPAPPSATPVAMPGAPQNEDWSNVSHINGVPVKVGERGDYLYSFKKNNISGNPFGLFFGLYDVAYAHALGQNLAISGSITAIDDYQQIAVTAPLYFRRTFSGPFLEGGLVIRSEKTYNYDYAYDCYDCSTSSMNETWTGPTLMFGWHWTFDSGLNIALASGLVKNLSAQNDYNDNVGFNGYFRVGYAF